LNARYKIATTPIISDISKYVMGAADE